MYTGAHWFSDVVGAALLAAIYLMLAWRVDRVIMHVRQISSERALATDAGLRGSVPVAFPTPAAANNDELGETADTEVTPVEASA